MESHRWKELCLETDLDQSDVVIVVDRVVIWMTIKVLNLKSLLGVLVGSLGMCPEDDDHACSSVDETHVIDHNLTLSCRTQKLAGSF